MSQLMDGEIVQEFGEAGASSSSILRKAPSRLVEFMDGELDGQEAACVQTSALG
jgi:hypothetical protein